MLQLLLIVWDLLGLEDNVIFTKVEETEEEKKVVTNIVDEEIDDGVNELGKNSENGHHHNDINNAIHHNNEPNFSKNAGLVTSSWWSGGHQLLN